MRELHERVIENMMAVDVRPSSRPDEYFIFCVGQTPDRLNAFKHWVYEEGIGCKPLIGSYQNQIEHSFIANQKDFDRIKPWIHDQETVLLLGTRGWQVREATLQYVATGRSKAVGRFKAVTAMEALAQDSWTLDPFTGQYYVCM